MTVSRFDFAATGNQDFGYFGAGRNDYGGPYYTTVDRIDYSNDTPTASPKGSLSFSPGRYGIRATGNANFGYFGGGKQPSTYSSVDRIDYSNDTATSSPKGPLSGAKYNTAATGNADFGYFGGGFPGPLSTVDRIDYSNDTVDASPKGSLSDGRPRLGASSARANAFGPIVGPSVVSNADAIAASFNPTNFGYFGGGRTPSTVSTVDRIDYSNDTVDASPKGPLSSARYSVAATGNSFFRLLCWWQSFNSSIYNRSYRIC